MSEAKYAGSESFISRIEYWEREKRNAVGQAHSLNSGIGPEGMTPQQKQAAADKLLDYAASCREIAWRERTSWVQAVFMEVSEIVHRPDLTDADRKAALNRLIEVRDWITSLPAPGK